MRPRLLCLPLALAVLVALVLGLMPPGPTPASADGGYWKLVDRKGWPHPDGYPGMWNSTVTATDGSATVTTNYTAPPDVGQVQWTTNWATPPDSLVPGQSFEMSLKMQLAPSVTLRTATGFNSAEAGVGKYVTNPGSNLDRGATKIVEASIEYTKNRFRPSDSKTAQATVPAYGFGNSSATNKMQLQFSSTMVTTGYWEFVYVYQWVPGTDSAPPPPGPAAPAPPGPPGPPSPPQSTSPSPEPAPVGAPVPPAPDTGFAAGIQPNFGDALAGNTVALETFRKGSELYRGTNDIYFDTTFDPPMVGFAADTSYLAYPGAMLNPSRGTVLIEYLPVLDLPGVYAAPHTSWTNYGSIPPPASGFVFDTVGWTAAYPGAFSLVIAPGQSISIAIYDGGNWHLANWTPPAEFWSDPAPKHEIGFSYGPAGLALVVDGEVRATSAYTGGVAGDRPWFVGQAPWNSPYGPHSILGWFGNLRVYDAQMGR